jgi:two-component system sensor histidine kinase QseC
MPIEIAGVPRELSPVVRALNDLLSRVTRTIEHERRFVDAAAHELRTPLAALKIHAENVARAETRSERQQSGVRLLQGLDRLVKLAEQMLAYSRSQAGVDSERRVPVAVADSISEAISALDPLWRAKSQRIRVRSSTGSELATILAEPVKVQRLVQNLVDNASRYGPPDSEIVVSLDLVNGRLVLEITNGGFAVPEDLRERVFEPYFRFAANGTEGSGLGLAIVKEIADQYGATVNLRSRADAEGTVVTISFPVHQVSDASRAVAV